MTTSVEVRIRRITDADVDIVHQLICDLADFEKEPDAVLATAEDLRRALFNGSNTPSGSPALYGHVAEVDGVVVGMALWFLNYSTWRGKHGVYLEDLYVRPEFRGEGIARRLIAALAAECRDRGYARLEWWVLDWNKSAIGFYRHLGAVPMDEWTVFRLTDEALTHVAGQTAMAVEQSGD